ncbi:MAG: DMT family transporter [Deltaproteobacteria bacterium]|nr:DMT family transporter [Deltaproteobacteria bacterium]
MSHVPFLGELLSLLTALVWAVGVVLFKKSGETVSPVALNMFKNALAAALLVPTMPLFGVPFFPNRPASDWALLAVSGVLGISVADTLFFMALERLGAGLLAVVDTLYSPMVIALSFAFLGERLGSQALFGAALVTSAILIGAAGRPDPGRTRKDIAAGLTLAIASVALMAVGIVLVKRVVSEAPIAWTTTVRVLCGGVGLLPLLAVGKHRRAAKAAFTPSRSWRHMVPGAFFGTYCAMFAWIGGMKYTLASVASVMNQLSTMFIFVLAALFLRERVTARRVAAIALAMAGAILVTFR